MRFCSFYRLTIKVKFKGEQKNQNLYRFFYTQMRGKYAM